MPTSLPIPKENTELLNGRLRALVQTLITVGAFSFDDSPLLQGWSEWMAPDQIDANNPDDVAFLARWESEEEFFEQAVTIGHLVQSLNLMPEQGASCLEFDDKSGRCKLNLFDLKPRHIMVPARQ